MILRWGLYLALLASPVTGAAITDISSETSALVRTGDSLVFHLFTRNFVVNAAALDLATNPTSVSFALVSAPLTGAGGFAATLESEDRTVKADFGTLSFETGTFRSRGHTAKVSAMEGFLTLSPELSGAIFATSSVIIALRNEGPDVTVGLAPSAIRQSLFTSLSGGGLSVGAIPGWVDLETGQNRARLVNFEDAVSLEDISDVPEPHSGGLFLGGGAVLCGLSAVLARLSKRAANRYRAKNQPFASANPL